MKGVYVVVAEIKGPVDIPVSHRLKFTLKAGFYAYVGSALSSLESRVARHLTSQKKCYWHIDRLLIHGAVRAVICAETQEKVECVVADGLFKGLPSVPRFGSSDCRCPSHLFFCNDFEAIKSKVLDVFRHLSLSPFEIAGYGLDSKSPVSSTGTGLPFFLLLPTR